MNVTAPFTEALSILYQETEDFLHVPNEISEIDVQDTLNLDWPLEFYKNYVSKNKPLIIRNGCKDFPANKKWSFKYFSEILSEKEVIVAVTPNGYADGIAMSSNPSDNTEYFILPEERVMKMKSFLNYLKNPENNVICYIQRQNSNLNDFPELVGDIGNGFEWALKVFGANPDNVNFWMGDQRAVTSMHKDPYENIYCVLDGYKEFILISPTDLPYVPYKNYPVAKYSNVTPENFEVVPEMEKGEPNFIRWISVNPLDESSINQFPEFRKARKYNIRIEEGDVLYIPSLWFHHVRQSHGCIAVNFWYDMEFDIKYCYFKMLERMCENLKVSSM